ncbi:putative membrane protein (plasmid) [Rhizobium favelukesii]|uniref:Membrane protein n=1 Tax=Rhizobium favelukesii TaxID=348824 RepID=W6RGQ7_9HYPH|nr:putative membrane protein [Rhizobium favelukesii]
MRYARDDARAYAIKIVSVLLASAVTAGVPTWIVARAMGF